MVSIILSIFSGLLIGFILLTILTNIFTKTFENLSCALNLLFFLILSIIGFVISYSLNTKEASQVPTPSPTISATPTPMSKPTATPYSPKKYVVHTETPDSSYFDSISYLEATQELMVSLKTGEIYYYYDVPQAVYDEFSSAESHDDYFNQNIKGNYDYKCFYDESWDEMDADFEKQIAQQDEYEKGLKDWMNEHPDYEGDPVDGYNEDLEDLDEQAQEQAEYWAEYYGY